MISFVEGEIVSLAPEGAVVLVGGVGLLVHCNPDTLAELYQMCKAYQQLWSAGKVGSAEMQALMVKLRDWLKNEGIFSADDPGLRETLQNPCMAKYSGLAGSFNCDPDAQAMIKAILGVPN